jgi:hypothetical protein
VTESYIATSYQVKDGGLTPKFPLATGTKIFMGLGRV